MANIWIIDDEESIRTICTSALEDLFTVESFANASEALLELNSTQPDLIITDIKMPGMSGLEFLDKVSDKFPEIPTIIITAHANIDNALSAYKGGAFEYLTKPFDINEIRKLAIKATRSSNIYSTDLTNNTENNIVGKRGEGWSVANATLSHERGSLSNPNAMMNRLNALIERMKNETINGQKVIDNPVYRDKLMKIQGKVIAFQSNSLRVLSAKLNKNQDVKIAGMIQKYVGTELRHELEGFAIDIMGELGTLYQNSPNLRDGGSWQIAYMYFLGLIIGGGTSQIQKNIISERGLGMPKEPKVQQGA